MRDAHQRQEAGTNQARQLLPEPGTPRLLVVREVEVLDRPRPVPQDPGEDHGGPHRVEDPRRIGVLGEDPQDVLDLRDEDEREAESQGDQQVHPNKPERADPVGDRSPQPRQELEDGSRREKDTGHSAPRGVRTGIVLGRGQCAHGVLTSRLE